MPNVNKINLDDILYDVEDTAARTAAQTAQAAAANALAAAKSAKFTVKITFTGGAFENDPFTVTAPDFTYSGTVPGSRIAEVSVPYENTSYLVTLGTVDEVVNVGYYFGVYPVTLEGVVNIPDDLRTATWDQIAAAAESGNAQDYWNVNDEIDVQLTTGEILTLQIYGFNHDNLVAGGKAGITFGMKNLMAAARAMNNGWTNHGGFTGSAMYAWLSTTLWGSLPQELRDVIKPVIKLTSAGGAGATINQDSVSLFLFSEIECFGYVNESFPGEGAQYSTFTNTANLSKRNGSMNSWWLRSPERFGDSGFCCIHWGYGDTSWATELLGVCFGFCV